MGSRGEEGPLPPQLLSDSCRVQRAHRGVEESSWYRLLLHQLGYLGSHLAQDVRIRTTAYPHHWFGIKIRLREERMEREVNPLKTSTIQQPPFCFTYCSTLPTSSRV